MKTQGDETRVLIRRSKKHNPHHVVYREAFDTCMEYLMHNSASIFAMNLGNSGEDETKKAQSLYRESKYKEFLEQVKGFRSKKTNSILLITQLLCWFALGEWQSCINRLRQFYLDSDGTLHYPEAFFHDGEFPKFNSLGTILFLKAKAYQGLGANHLALLWGNEAVRINPWCTEAINLVMDLIPCTQQVPFLSPLLRKTMSVCTFLTDDPVVVQNNPGLPELNVELRHPLASLIRSHSILQDDGSPQPHFADAPTELIWDLENEPVPKNRQQIDVLEAMERMKLWLKAHGYIGPIKITVVVGARQKNSDDKLNQAESVGLIDYHICGSEKQAADNKINNILEEFACNPPHPELFNICILAGDGTTPIVCAVYKVSTTTF